jgi:hypothetical protein
MSPEDFNAEEPDEPEADEPTEFEIEVTKDEVASKPADTGDPTSIVEEKIPQDIRDRYEVFSYRNAAVILSETRKAEFSDLLKALREFRMQQQEARLQWGDIRSRSIRKTSRQIRLFGRRVNPSYRLLS